MRATKYAAATATVILGLLFAPCAWSAGTCDIGGLQLAAVRTSPVGIGDTLLVQVNGLKEKVESGQCDPSLFRLHLNGHQFQDLKADPADIHNGKLTFLLKRTTADQDKDAWTSLLGAPSASGRREVSVGVGLAGSPEIPSVNGVQVQVALIIFQPTAFWLAAVSLLVLLLLFIHCARRSDLVRDDLPVTLAAGQQRAYSLARCQMAYWTFIVVASFLFLFAATGNYNDIITSQTLILLGISGGTGLAAVAMDIGKGNNPWPVHETLLSDLLTDETGMTVHRFQMLVWSLVLGVIYIVSVYRTMKLPEFDPNLLTLMGISSGTYLGFKYPEKQA